MIPEQHVRVLSGRYYRMKFLHEAEDILGPARAAEGRSHYGGQRALYLLETERGTAIASKRYVRPGDPPRAIFPLLVTAARVVDLRDAEATKALCIDTTHRAADWQSIRARGLPSPTWEISDRVRDLGLDGMLYASRSEPSLTHLTLFRWNSTGAAQVRRDGDPEPWPQPAKP